MVFHKAVKKLIKLLRNEITRGKKIKIIRIVPAPPKINFFDISKFQKLNYKYISIVKRIYYNKYIYDFSNKKYIKIIKKKKKIMVKLCCSVLFPLIKEYILF